MNTRHTITIVALLLVVVFVLIVGVSNYATSAGDTGTAEISDNSVLKYKLNTNGAWAYIEVITWNAKALLEMDAKLLAELDKAVAAVGKRCGEHILRTTTNGVKGALCKVEEIKP